MIQIFSDSTKIESVAGDIQQRVNVRRHTELRTHSPGHISDAQQ